MLVLTRKANQQIQIGENVFITVLSVKGNSVRIGIEAPREVRVVRGELERKEKEKELVAAEAVVNEPVAAEIFQAAEMIVPQGPQAQVLATPRSPALSTSLKQEPAEAAAMREVRCSPLLRYIAAGAATDAPVARPTRSPIGFAGQRASGASY